MFLCRDFPLHWIEILCNHNHSPKHISRMMKYQLVVYVYNSLSVFSGKKRWKMKIIFLFWERTMYNRVQFGEEWESKENIIMLKCRFWVRERESIMENYNVLLLLLKSGPRCDESCCCTVILAVAVSYLTYPVHHLTFKLLYNFFWLC